MLNMDKFIIEITPELPKLISDEIISSDYINLIDTKVVLAELSDQYEIIYHLAGNSYRYYPASILTILNDLHIEWELIRSRVPHAMTLSGYTVLAIDFVGEAALFADPLDRSTSGASKRIGEPIWVLSVEEAFRIAIERVLRAIRSAG
jgi:hypothetical protein